MVRTRDQVVRRDQHRNDGKYHGGAMKLKDPFDLALYTVYMQPDSQAKNFHDGDAAWTKFLAARPLLYLPDRSPTTDEDPINHNRRLWTHQELQAFGDVVEERTRVQLLAQERTLRRWHQSATHIQRHFRGMRDRLYVLRLRRKLFEYAATLDKAMELARKRRKPCRAAGAIQRAYRSHRKFATRQQQAAVMLQRSCKRYMNRLRRWQARITMQRAARCYLWRLRWQRSKQRVRKMLKAVARQQQLVESTAAFQRLRESVLLQRQVDTWVSHPEQMQMLLRVRRRKQKLQGLHIFPPLQDSAEHSTLAKGTNKPVRSFRRPQQGLPSIHASSRRE